MKLSKESKRKISLKARERYSDPRNHPNFGKHLSKETRDKIAKGNRGKKGLLGKDNPMYGRTTTNPMYGKHHSEETKQKIALTSKGRWLGRKHKEESKLKCQMTHKKLVALGIHPSWKGGKTTETKMLRTSKKYRDWRKAVFERDNYTCKLCQRKGGYLEADHRRPFSLFPELRFVVENGRTLCRKCHKNKTAFDNVIRKNSDYYLVMLSVTNDLDKYMTI